MTSSVASLPAPRGAEFEQRLARLEGLLAELSSSSDPVLEQRAREVVATVLELHRRGLERILELTASESTLREALAREPELSALLLLHGLHPIPLAERVARTLASLRERYRDKLEQLTLSAETSAELELRAVPAKNACQATRRALQKELVEALSAALPDVESVRVELQEAPPALVTLRLPKARASGQIAGGSS
jgi:hypothetical protein